MNATRNLALTTIVLSAIAVGCVTTVSTGVRPAPAPVVAAAYGPEDEPFYGDLSPYGEWVYVSGPGWVWSPSVVTAGWEPYRLGHWVLTDCGWTWASDEEFGWAVYHYGRWHADARYGWVWVPGTDWAPAWVAWQEGNGWVGWAPLPYQVRWSPGAGLDWGGVNVGVVLGPSSWRFVETRYLVDPVLTRRIVPASRNVTIIRNTVHVTQYVTVDNRIVNQSVRPEKVGRAVGHTIPRYRLSEVDAPGAPRGEEVRDGEFVAYRPGRARGGQRRGERLPEERVTPPAPFSPPGND